MEKNYGGNRLAQVHLEKWPLKRSVCIYIKHIVIIYNFHKLCCERCRYVTRLCYFVDDDLLASASGVCTALFSDLQQIQSVL